MGKNKKNNKKKIIIFSVLGVLVIALIIVAIVNSNKEKITKVTTEIVEKRKVTQIVNATGTINPIDQVIITPEVTGEIVQLPVQEGDIVKKGTLLIRIKPDIYIAKRNRAIASLEAAKAGLSVSHASLEKIEAEYERMKKLFAKQLASQQDLDALKANFLSAKGQYESQIANVHQNEESLKEQEEDLAKTSIYSPLDGVVSKLNVEFGERVLGSGFSQGTDIMTIADLNNMEAVVEVDENDVVLVSVGDTSTISIDAFGEEKFKGVVYQVGNSAIAANLGTQNQVVNFEVKIKLIGKNEKLKPGMSCDSDIETETKMNVITVPIQSVTARMDTPIKSKKQDSAESEEIQAPTNGKKHKLEEIVFIYKDGKTVKKPVKTGISDDYYIEIISGLSVGDEVISGPYKSISRELEDGSQVVKEEKSNSSKFSKK